MIEAIEYTDLIDPERIAPLVKLHITARYGLQAKAAKRWGVSLAFVNAVTTGVRPPTERILREMRLEKVRGFVWVPTASFLFLLLVNDPSLTTMALARIGQRTLLLWKAGDEAGKHDVMRPVRDAVRLFLDGRYSNHKSAAAAWRCSPGMVTAVLAGTKLPSANMLVELGLVKVTGYRAQTT